MGRMGPRTERTAGQRTFLLLMLIAVVLFGVHFESDCDGFKICQLLYQWNRNISYYCRMISVVLCKVSQPSRQKRKGFDENFVTAKCACINDSSFHSLTFADASTIIMRSVGLGYELSQRKNKLSRFPWSELAVIMKLTRGILCTAL